MTSNSLALKLGVVILFWKVGHRLRDNLALNILVRKQTKKTTSFFPLQTSRLVAAKKKNKFYIQLWFWSEWWLFCQLWDLLQPSVIIGVSFAATTSKSVCLINMCWFGFALYINRRLFKVCGIWGIQRKRKQNKTNFCLVCHGWNHFFPPVNRTAMSFVSVIIQCNTFT